MEEIVFISKNGKPVTSSRFIAQKFQREHKSVLRSIDNLECSDEFKGRNFALLINNDIKHPSPIIQEREFIMTRDGFSFLAMGFTGKEAAKFKEDFINAFNKMEALLFNGQRIALPDFNDPVKAARAWADAKEQQQLAESKVKELAPKAEVYDQISECSNLKSVGEVAKLIGTGEHRLFHFMRENRIIMDGTTIPYQRFITAGYFQVKTRPIPGRNQNYSQSFFTAKGELWIADVYKNCHR